MHFGTFPILGGTPEALGKRREKRAPGAKLMVMRLMRPLPCRVAALRCITGPCWACPTAASRSS